ncbi:MAG: Na/Pi cotransporter family protein [Pseudomonadota bacterium]
MVLKFIFGLVGGLGLFIFGMKVMSEGLQKTAGDRMRRVLEALTNNRFIGIMVGLIVTSIVQSSSAVTVMTIGFVNAGLMSLLQAIGVVLGANIGTTVTAQIIAFKVTNYALPAIGLGVVFKLFARKKKWQYVGDVTLGFGILFFGLSIMQDSFRPLRESEAFINAFAIFGNNPFLGILLGTVLTIIVQSSSATIGITMALASSGLLSFYGSVALILGENIGTTSTALMSSIGTNITARRTAISHLLFNAIGVMYIFFLLPVFTHFINFITPGEADFVIQTAQEAQRFGLSIGDKPYIARHIANAHTLFNVVNCLIFLPFIGVLAKVSTTLIPGKAEEIEPHLIYLDNRVLDTPPIAIGQVRAETHRMAEIAYTMFEDTMSILFENDIKKAESVLKSEDTVDILQKEIIQFCSSLSQRAITPEISQELTSIIHMANDLERIGDHSENLVSFFKKKFEGNLYFTPAAMDDVKAISEEVKKFLRFVIDGMKKRDKRILLKALDFESRINEMEDTMRNTHIVRLNAGECKVEPGLIFADMLINFEKIGDHSYNIAEAVVGIK